MRTSQTEPLERMKCPPGGWEKATKAKQNQEPVGGGTIDSNPEIWMERERQRDDVEIRTKGSRADKR